MPTPSGKPAAPGSTFASQHDMWQPRPWVSPMAQAAAAPAAKPVGPEKSQWSKAAEADKAANAAKPARASLGGLGGGGGGGAVFSRPSVLPGGGPGAPVSAEFGGVSIPAPPPVPVPVAAPVQNTGVSAPGIQMDGQTPQVFPRPGVPAIAPGLQPPAPVNNKAFWDNIYATHPGAGTNPTKQKGRPRR